MTALLESIVSKILVVQCIVFFAMTFATSHTSGFAAAIFFLEFVLSLVLLFFKRIRQRVFKWLQEHDVAESDRKPSDDAKKAPSSRE